MIEFSLFHLFYGEEALRLYDSRASEIDLAFLDVMMPKLGGRAVYDQVRLSRPELHVLFASGYSPAAIHANFILADGLDLIQKPYQRDGLLKKIREVLDA